MEQIINKEGDNQFLVPITRPDQTALDIIRTETVISKLPRHILSKSGKRPEIRLEKFTPDGKLDLRWVVSYNELYGPARQLAYDLDTLIVERAIEETFNEARRSRQPLPRLIPIGSLRDLCRKLNLEENGTNAAKIKRALQQNAGAVINAVLSYKSNDDTEYSLDATFTCYGVFFTGKQLPDGRKAEQTYVSTTNEYHRVISTVPTRPLDYTYKRQLPPTPRRLYEILSYSIYGALKNHKPFAQLLYSDYCARAPHVRYFTFDQVKKQMYTVNKPHKESGYITSVKYRFITDPKGNPDWMMLYTPGPKAQDEFDAVHPQRNKKRGPNKSTLIEAGESTTRQPAYGSAHRGLKLGPEPAQLTVDPQLVAKIAKWGIAETAARKAIASSTGQPVEDKIDFAVACINQGGIAKPDGFIISVLKDEKPVPSNFETRAQRKAREEHEEEERRRDDERRAQQELEAEYHWYCTEGANRYIETLDPAEVAAVRDAKWQENREKHQSLPPGMIDSFAEHDTRIELGKRAPLMTIEEFKASREQGNPLFLKLVPDQSTVELVATELAPVISPPEEIVLDQLPATDPTEVAAAGGEMGEAIQPPTEPATPSEQLDDTSTDVPAIAAEKGVAIEPAANPATEPATSEPMIIELASEPPLPPKPDNDASGPQFA